MMLKSMNQWKAIGAFLFAAGVTFGAAGTTQAGDCCDSCCEPDRIFCSAGDKLCGRMKSLCGLWKGNDSCCVDDCCIEDYCTDDCCGDSCVECCAPGWEFGGWMQTGQHSKNNSLFNNHQDRINLHQAWLYAEKKADGRNGWGFGGRVDMMWGVDGQDTQAFGNANNQWDFDGGRNVTNGYGFALPQAYVEVANGDWSMIAGHFYTLLGYEVVTAPDNFFYSHAMTMYNSEAFTHTGVLATHQTTDTLETYFGTTLGWDTAFDQNAGGFNFLGGFSKQLTDATSLTYITTAGDLGANGTGYAHSLVLNMAVSEDLNYIIQSDYIDATAYAPYSVAGVATGPTEAIGINQYLIYSIVDSLAVGGRFEWWRTRGSDSFSLTTGLNIKPMDNLTIRPEMRYYFADPLIANLQNTIAGDKFNDTVVFGVDAILTF